MAKIIRKRNNGCEIPEHNYQQIITDLIGVRALYLLKKLKKFIMLFAPCGNKLSYRLFI